MSTKIIRFRTQDQVNLWNNEITGQLSDGHWENAIPNDHWKVWCDAEAVVDTEKQGVNFWPKKKYNLLATELLEVIGNRMIGYVKLGRIYGSESVRLLDHLFENDSTDSTENNWIYKYVGLPTYEGKYWDEIRTKLSVFNLTELQIAFNNEQYTMKNLKTDLKEMKSTMQNMLGYGD